MKKSSAFILFVVAGIVLPAALAAHSLAAAQLPRLNLQESGLSPETKAAPSFSPMVKRVSPSVVNIYTTRKVKDSPRMTPLFDDPSFGQFFGDPWGGQGRVPQERREQALGSAVIISEDAYLPTNNQVVDGVAMDRRRVTSAADVLEYSRQSKADRVLLQVWRDGGTRCVVIHNSQRK